MELTNLSATPVDPYSPTGHLRWKAGRLQQLWDVSGYSSCQQTLEWRDVPTVPDDAPDDEVGL